MLRALAIALLKSVRRDLGSYTAIRTNNFFLFVCLLIWGNLESGVEPVSSYPFLLVLAVLMFFPTSSSLLHKIPRVRLQLWPLNRLTRLALSAAGLQARRVPRALPIPIRYGGLIANHLRQLLTLLDTWLALAIAAGGGIWRLFAVHPDPAAWPILSLLAALALGTCTQSPFALDGDSGLTRYHLFPLRGWQIVLAKDLSYLAILLLAILPLAVIPGLAFGLTALAVGRYPAMRLRLLQQRWRFTSGRVLWGVVQCVVAGILGFAYALPVAFALYVLSLWWAGRQWDHA